MYHNLIVMQRLFYMKRLSGILALAVMFFGCGKADAFVAQDASSALSYQNYGRDGDSGNAAQKASSGYVSYGGDMNVDHEGIADKMIMKNPSGTISVDFRNEKTTQQAMFPDNYNFKVILPEVEGANWVIDTNKEFAIQVDSQSNGKVKVVEFHLIKAGQTVIYFDNMTTSAPYKSLQSKVLRIRIVK